MMRHLPPFRHLASKTSDGIAAIQNALDQGSDGRVKLRLGMVLGHVHMRRRGVLEDAYDLGLGQDLPVVEGQQQRLADRKRCRAGNIVE